MYNIDPKRWGSSGWNFLYYVALAYPDTPCQTDKENYMVFYSTIGKILPCEVCKHNYMNHIKKHSLNNTVLSSRYHLLNWLININNEVNITKGKPLITYDQVVSKYLGKKNKLCINIDYDLIYLVLLILIIFILIMYMKSRYTSN